MTANNPDQDDFDPSLEDKDDDFAYEEESFGDEEFSDEESWDGESDEAVADEAPEKAARKAKKKGGLFNVILVLAAIIGGGGFVYLKVLAPPAGSPAAPAEQAVAEAPAAPEAQAQMESVMPPTPAPLTPSEPEITDNSLTPVPESLSPEALPESPALAALSEDPVATEASTAPAEQQPIEVASAPPMPAPMATPESEKSGGFVAGLPSAKDIMIAPAETTEPEKQSIAESSGSVLEDSGLSADVAKSIEQKLSVLIARLDTFEGRISNLENGLHQVSTKISAVESAPAPVADLSAVNKTLQSLEQKITSLEKGGLATAENEISKIEEPTFVPAPESEPEQDVASKTQAASAKTSSGTDSTSEEAVTEPVKPQKANIAKEVVKTPSWVLRSAQPGSAMVSSKSGGDMRSVRVGDSLSGLGKIISIEMKGSRWVVQGTQGTLTH